MDFYRVLCWGRFVFNICQFIAASVSCTWKTLADDYKLYFSFLQDTCVSILLGMMQLQKDLNKVCLVLKS